MNATRTPVPQPNNLPPEDSGISSPEHTEDAKIIKKPTVAEMVLVDIEKIDIKKMDLSPEDIVVPRSSSLTNTQLNKILAKGNEKWKTGSEDTVAIISILLQQGGTAKSCDGNLTIQFKNKDYKLSQLRAILKEESLARNERKLARSLATQIYIVSCKLDLPGNLAKQIKLNFPQERILDDEIYWLSDFQTNNFDCPEHIRNLLNKNFALKRNPPSKSNQKN